MLQAVNKLSRWQLIPVVARFNELRAYLAATTPSSPMAGHWRRLDELAEETRATRRWLVEQLEEIRGALAWQQNLRGEDRAELASRLAALEPPEVASLGAATASPAEQAPRHFPPAAFYEAHQERFRGSREEIRERLAIYLPHVQQVVSGDQPVLDIGPGRGEWLELLREHGIPAYGVDVNEQFVSNARRANLDVRLEDGVDHLRCVRADSLAAITAFHVVEHIPTDMLVELVEQSLRALRPGGLLIIETPNPLNLAVGAAWFNIDPTHVRAIHPLFLEFVVENRGFVNVRVLPLHPPEARLAVPPQGDMLLRQVTELLHKHLLTGQDYAVVAHRAPATTGQAIGDVATPAHTRITT
jgi:O-antigen chain-terminating methyltransferase